MKYEPKVQVLREINVLNGALKTLLLCTEINGAAGNDSTIELQAVRHVPKEKPLLGWKLQVSLKTLVFVFEDVLTVLDWGNCLFCDYEIDADLSGKIRRSYDKEKIEKLFNLGMRPGTTVRISRESILFYDCRVRTGPFRVFFVPHLDSDRITELKFE